MWLYVHECKDEWGGTLHVLSIDFYKEMERLPEQEDEIGLLLADVDVLMCVEPRAPPPPSPKLEGARDLVTPVRSRPCSPPPPPPSPSNKPVVSRMRHNLLTDALIVKWVNRNGPQWRKLSRSLGGRQAGYTDDCVRNRYIRIMEASGMPYTTTRVRTNTPKKPERPVESWSVQDDEQIRRGLLEYGPRWPQIAALMFSNRRTPQAVRNRANRIGLVGSNHLKLEA